jgi:hypothetical protein
VIPSPFDDGGGIEKLKESLCELANAEDTHEKSDEEAEGGIGYFDYNPPAPKCAGFTVSGAPKSLGKTSNKPRKKKG